MRCGSLTISTYPPCWKNTHFLPIGITAKLLGAQSQYVHAKERGISTEHARRLASELMVILRQMAPLIAPNHTGTCIVSLDAPRCPGPMLH